jgi:hypothetical protein
MTPKSPASLHPEEIDMARTSKSVPKTPRAPERGEVGIVEPAKAPKRAPPAPQRHPSSSALREENTITPAKARDRKSQATQAELPFKPVLTKGELPSAVARRYNAEPGLFRRHIDYYEGGGATKPAFRDRGDKLVAFQNDPATISSLVAIARHRGWSSLEVRGDDTFRREVWMEAQKLGIKVRGYKPKARDRDEASKQAQAKTEKVKGASHVGSRPRSRDRQVTEQTSSAPTPPPKARPDFDKGVTGVLLEHGAAPYRHKDGAPLAPFVKLDIGASKPLEVWGVGLPAAVTAAKAKIGDTLTLRREAVDHVEVLIDGPGAPPRDVRRNRWTATSQRSAGAKPARATRGATLAAAQARLAVVETVARAKLVDPKDQAKVVAAAKNRISKHIAEGRTFSTPTVADPKRSRDRPARDESDPSRGPERVRGR